MTLTDRIVRGMIIKINEEPHLIMEREFYKPGKGNAFNRTKLKNLINGKIFTQTYKSGEKVDEVDVESKSMQYLYSDGTEVFFMDPVSFDQMSIQLEQIPGGTDYLHTEGKYIMMFYEGKAISVQPPIKISLRVTETSGAVKGNTAGNATKEAILETGAKVQVPLFIKEGDMVVINTENGTYDSKGE